MLVGVKQGFHDCLNSMLHVLSKLLQQLLLLLLRRRLLVRAQTTCGTPALGPHLFKDKMSAVNYFARVRGHIPTDV